MKHWGRAVHVLMIVILLLGGSGGFARAEGGETRIGLETADGGFLPLMFLGAMTPGDLEGYGISYATLKSFYTTLLSTSDAALLAGEASREDVVALGNQLMSGILVTPATVSLLIGAGAQLNVTGQFSDNTSINLSNYAVYTSSQAVTVTVDTLGKLKALAAGTANVTASYGSYSAVSKVTVSNGNSDTTPPTVPTLTLSQPAWTNQNVTVTLTPGTDAGGIAKSEYRLGATGTWQTYSTAITVSAEGSTNVYARSTDKAGNVGPEATATVRIDKTVPALPGLTKNKSGWTKDNIVFTLTGTDSGSGVDKLQYKLGTAGAWTDTTGTFTVTTAGENTIYGRVIDKAGNISSSASAVAQIDQTAPTAPGEPAIANPLGDSITLTWAASTDNVGVTGYEVYRNDTKIADSTVASYTATGLVDKQTYNFTVKAKDAAGNVSAASAGASLIARLPKDYYVDFPETLDNSALRSKVLSIPGLLAVKDVTNANGTVSFTVSGTNITVTAGGGTATRTANNPTKYSKAATSSVQNNNVNTFTATVPLSTADGYSGTLSKSGSPTVVSGTLIAAQSKTVNLSDSNTSSSALPATKAYSLDGFSGTLNATGNAYQLMINKSKEIIASAVNQFPATISEDDGTYVGTYYSSGNIIDASYNVTNTLSKQFSGNYSCTERWKYVYNYGRLVSSTLISGCPDGVYYEEDGYAGYLNPVSSTCTGSMCNYSAKLEDPLYLLTELEDTQRSLQAAPEADPQVIPAEPEEDLQAGIIQPLGFTPPVIVPCSSMVAVCERTASSILQYGGTLYKDVTTIVPLYKQNYSGVFYSHTFYRNYSGTVTKPAVDTRLWEQKYSGTVYKAGIDTFYSYRVKVTAYAE